MFINISLTVSRYLWKEERKIEKKRARQELTKHSKRKVLGKRDLYYCYSRHKRFQKENLVN